MIHDYDKKKKVFQKCKRNIYIFLLHSHRHYFATYLDTFFKYNRKKNICCFASVSTLLKLLFMYISLLR